MHLDRPRPSHCLARLESATSGNTALRFLGVGNLLDREYRNSPAYQWGRELARNGIEADATIIQFGPEWQGVAATGTYRMQYADNGQA